MLIYTATAQAEQTIHLVTPVDQQQAIGKAQAQLIKTLFELSQIPYTLSYRPARRAELELQEQKFDGDAGRSAEFGLRYPKLIRVEPSYFPLYFYAISYEQHIRQWSDLYGLDVAYPRGIVTVELQLGGRANLNPNDSISACIRMVKARRVQVCVLNSGTPVDHEFHSATPALKKDEFARMGTHIWLDPKHQAVAKKLSRALEKMQKDGSLARFQQQITKLE
ncbi:hypothetical protein ABHF33_10540 [Chitinibacter sp. FCG-7]|uniref:Transporter substrate-binding domain-containing protein n=1 Tax=Chitinibacter mangrovi TaxID=3153927 RepID=A0AAU7F5U7_9NEIS